MSVSRPARSAQYFSLSEVDVYVILSPVTITGVTNGGTYLHLAVSDPNGGADLTSYTYIIQRSVDGSPFSVVSTFVYSGIATYFNDYTIPFSGAALLSDGTAVSLPPGTYVTVVTFGTSTQAYLLFDTAVTINGNSLLLPSGTPVTLPVAKGSGDAFSVPTGHTYSYKISSLNKYASTPLSAASSVTVAPTFTAQTMAAPTRADNQITLSWTDPNSYSTGDMIEVWKQVGAGTGYSLLATITKSSGAMPTSYVDAFNFFTLVPATYYYQIRARSGSLPNVGPFSAPVNITVAYTLSALTGLTAVVAGGGSQINLTWADPNLVAVEGGLYVYRDAGNTGVFSRVANIAYPPQLTAYSDVFSTVPGQVYAYKVAAYNHLHEGPASATASVTAALAAPTITSVVQAADVGAVITWTDTNTLETAYTLQRSINGSAFSTITAAIPGGTLTYQDSFSQPIGTTIAYKVMATNTTANSAYSAASQITLSAQLVSPINVNVVISQTNKIVVTWANVSPLIRGTYVMRSINGGAMTLVATTAASVTEFDDILSTAAGSVYAYSIQNFDNQETGPLSVPVAATTPFDPPQNVTVTASLTNTATLTWTTRNTAMDYTSIEIAFANNGAYTEAARIPPGQTTSTVTITGGTPGEAVAFRLREIKQPYVLLGNINVSQNVGLYSLVVSTATALLAPSSVAVTRPTPTGNVITWNDANTAAIGFQVWRSVVNPGPTYSTPLLVGTTTNPATRSMTDIFPGGSGLTVQYWVYAYGALNSSPQSNIATLTTRFDKATLTTSQTARTQITLSMVPPVGYVYVAGDRVQISRSINGSTVVLTSITAFAVPTTYVDSAFSAPDNINATISYSIRFFSATEAGYDSNTVSQPLYDAVFIPLAVDTVRIFGSRNAYLAGGQGVFAGCSGTIIKITNDPTTYEPILLTSAPAVAGTKSISSGDLTRIVATGSGGMYLIDAGTLAPVIGPMSVNGWFGASNNSGSYHAVLAGQSANFSGISTGVYKGWTFAGPDNTNITGVAPWNSNGSSFVDVYGGVVVGSPNEPFIAVPGTPQPARLEVLGGDAVVFTLQTTISSFTSTYNTTMWQVQRSTNKAIEVFNIANYVTDIVADGTSKIFAVTVAGGIYVIDTSIVPVSGASGFLGYNPNPNGALIGQIPMPSVYTPYVPGTYIFANGHPGDIINFTFPNTDTISIELGAGQRIATATTKGNTTTVHIFQAAVAPISVHSSLSVLKTYTVNERINGLAFDGGKFFYGRSVDTNKLFRFDAGL